MKLDTANNVGTYVHTNGKIGVLVELAGGSEELARGLAMHVAAMNPPHNKAADVPAEFVAKEKEIELAKMSEKDKAKPAEILEKIISGKINKIISEVTLYGQSYVLDGDKTVEAVVKAAGADVVGFQRLVVGEGIEKVQEAMNAMASVMENDQSLRAATLVGRDVQISADKVTLAAGTEVKGEITATQAGPVQVEVLDEKGNVVQKMALNADASGQVAFQWDGKTENGDTAPAGNYSFRAVGGSGTEGESLSVRLISRIESVSIEPQGLVLNIAGLGSHALSTIRRIS